MGLGVTAASYVAGKLGEVLEDRFAKEVIGRWSKRRAEAFLDAFARGLAERWSNESTVAEAAERLEAVMGDKRASQHLFEGYRRVVLARSRDLGPRVIAVVTAELVREERTATWLEEAILDISEKMDDADFEEVIDIAGKHLNESGKESGIRWDVDSQTIHVSWQRSGTFRFGSTDLYDLGRWAVVLRDAGLLHEELVESYERYDADSERHIDEPGELRTLTRTIVISPHIGRLAELALLAIRFRDTAAAQLE